jgi:hypothetical protein
LTTLEHRLQQWRKLAPWQQRVLCRQALVLPLVVVLLSLSSFKFTCRVLVHLSRLSASYALPATWQPADYAQRCAALTAIAAHHGLFKPTCLPQSLALQSVLSKSGLKVLLRIGVIPGSQPLQAHSWVDFGGVPLGQQSVSQYRVIELLDIDALQLD